MRGLQCQVDTDKPSSLHGIGLCPRQVLDIQNRPLQCHLGQRKPKVLYIIHLKRPLNVTASGLKPRNGGWKSLAADD